MPADDVPIAESKSALNKIRGITFAKRSNQFSVSQNRLIRSLEQQRKDLQDEITKLVMILEDRSLPMEDGELLEVNDQVNNLLSEKTSVEGQINKVSDGQINYGSKAGPSTLFRYFGRAKELNAKTEEEKAAKREAEKRRIFEVSEVKATTERTVVVQEHVANQARREFMTKKTRFDDSEDE